MAPSQFWAARIPFYAVRDQARNDLSEGCGSSHLYLDAKESLEFVAEMLDIAPEAISWQARPQKNIEFQSPQQFDDAAVAFIQGQQALYHTTVAALTAHGLLTQSEAQQVLPELYVFINDTRGRANPFPPPANLPPRVKWIVPR